MTVPSPATPTVRPVARPVAVAVAPRQRRPRAPERLGLGVLVVVAHAAGLLALAYVRSPEPPPEIRPIEIAFIPLEAPPQPEPVKPEPVKQAPQPKKPAEVRPKPPKPTPQPVAEKITASPNALSAEPAPPAPAQPAAPAVANPAPPAPPAPPPVVAARFDADYLNNPKPAYPPLSTRLREEGTVMLRVQVTAEGLPGQIEINRSSGFERLDSAARAAVARWRFVPARQGDRAIEAWVLVPLVFKLTEGR
ncbi:putative TonB protein [Azoarcus olearius]|uniref:energy transducer TonB n=1 Tax=Azoarcus sp. (strain BH72) TaxID=418699 RepID=UPI0008064086|nr:energy transducer TonB [Azoarcus olearius]ANQ83759.1 putative TonB protein [Azoarcus olearius]